MNDRLSTKGRAVTHRVDSDITAGRARAMPEDLPERAPTALPGSLTEISYSLPPDLTYERWESIGQGLQQMERSVQWWIGDWYLYGEDRFGERSAQAVMDLTGYERSSIQNYASVARAFPPGTRVQGVSFFHHRAVQSLARQDFDAATEVLRDVDGRDAKPTVEEFREEVRRVVQARALAAPPPADDFLPADIELAVGDATGLPLEDAGVDVIVTSPPFGLDKPYGVAADAADGWEAFMGTWLREANRVTRPGGRLALNVPVDTTKGAPPGQCRPALAQAVDAALAAGWAYKATIIWNEGTVSKSVARGSVDSPAAPHVIAPVEAIVLFSKGPWRRAPAGRTSDLSRAEWLEFTDGLWTIPGESNPWEGFPAAFPVEIPYRLIKLLSFKEDIIADLFLGSGTTAIAAWRLGRRFVGFDLSPAQIDSAKRRLAAVGRR